MKPNDGFTLEQYKRLLQNFIDGGGIIYPAGEPLQTNHEQVVYLRHDVDYSVQLAVEMAAINHDLGISGAFHIPVASPLFNLHAESNQYALEKIEEFDQRFALHFYLPEMLGSGTVSFDFLREIVDEQFGRLAAIIGPTLLKAFSWHNPSVLPDNARKLVTREFPDLLNLYAIGNHGVAYYSDSNNRYTVQEWEKLINSINSPTQLLFHPFHWAVGDESMEVVLARLWCHLDKIRETVFKTNVVYEERIPKGFSYEVEKCLQALQSNRNRSN